MHRLTDWRTRLFAFIASVERRPFQLGTWDCAIFTAAAVEAMTGVDLACDYRGRYATVDDGLRLLGADPVEAVRQTFPRVPVAQAQLGDIGVVRVDLGPALGIVGGDHVRLVGPEGMMAVALPTARLAFRV